MPSKKLEILRSWRIWVISVLVITTGLFLYFTISNAIILSKYNKLVSDSEETLNFYKDMCKNAYEHSEYRTTANITGYEYSQLADKYYVTYTFGNDYESDSYNVYTLEEAASLVGTTQQLALECPVSEMTATTDNMLMDFYQMDLFKEGEYAQIVHLRNTKAYHEALYVIATIASIGGIVLLVLWEINTRKKKSPEPKQEVQANNQ